MNFGGSKFNANDFGDGLDEDQRQFVEDQEQWQGYQDPNMYMGQQQYMGGGFPGQYDQQQQFGYQNQFAPQMNMGLGPQVSMPGQYAGFAPVVAAAPITEAAGEKKEESKGNSFTAAGFKKESLQVKEFIPKGVVVNTKEQFPDLDALDMDAPVQKKKKKGKGAEPVKVKVEPVEEQIDESTPWKGKKSEFFVMAKAANPPAIQDPNNPMGLELNDEQWNFIFLFYPEYASSPYQMLSWLFTQAQQQEQIMAAMYAKPLIGGKNSGEDSEEDDRLRKKESKYDRGFGLPGQKNSKQQTRKQDEEKRKALEKKEKEFYEKSGKTKKTETEIKEQKVLKAFKDKDVNMNPEGLVEVDTKREPISMVFIGHVDAGKSTICGNLMYMMGVVDARTIEKYKAEAKEKGRDSWWLAYVMDVSDDEKAKGKTVEVGRAQFDTPTKKYTIFDAPGHKNYVPNMIMGAALADVGGLVISARKGEFEAGFEKDGQTREHAQLAKSLGVQKLVIIVNKMDDCKWSKARFDEIKAGLNPFLFATGYTEEDLIYVPIAGLTGDNIQEKVDGKCNWYTGKPLFEILDEIPLEKRYPDGPLRLPVLDKMKDKDLIAHGKVENGTIRLGDKLAIMPSGNLAQVMGLLDAKGQTVLYATPGENVQIKLNVADDDLIQRGFVLCHRENRMPVTEIFEAEIDILELLEYKPILSKGYTCIMHIHTFNDEVVIKEILSCTETNDKGEKTTKLKPQFARSQNKIICRITPKNPIAIEKFDSIPQMGRFTLRDEGKTICIGKVLKYKPYTKIVGEQAKATAANANANATGGSSFPVTIDSSKAKEEIFDMETGESKPAPEKLTGIAEGDEDEDE